jgi:hypothetical protein
MSEGEKAYFNFSKGINTEASLVAWPDGYSADEENYELFIDGSRRKRRGIAAVSGISTAQAVTLGVDAQGTFYWDSVTGKSDVHFIIRQTGTTLSIYSNTKDMPLVGQLSLFLYIIPSIDFSLLANTPVDISFGRGKAVVVGKYIDPFLISYDANSSGFTTSKITLSERDFRGVDDSLAINQTATTLTPTIKYNLVNRGWTDALLAAYKAALGVYPPKTFIPWMGYVGASTAGVAEADWTKQFSPAALVAQLFQDVSAPLGHTILNPLVIPSALTSGGNAANPVSIGSWNITGIPVVAPITNPTFANFHGTFTLNMTTLGSHGLNVGDSIKISYNRYGWATATTSSGITNVVQGTLDGTYTVTSVPSASTLTFQITLNLPYFVQWITLNDVQGSLALQSNPVILSSTGLFTSERPTCTAFWSGRGWYSGIQDPLFTSRLYYSQIIQEDAQYGKCYQVADPTDKRISDLVDSDGGVLVIPEMGAPLRIIPLGNSIIVYATNGVWQVGPGQSGFFSPTSYSIRHITSAGLVSPQAVASVDDAPFYCGYNDIWNIVQEPQTGQLTANNITEKTTHSLYTGIVAKQFIKLRFDDLNRRIFLLYRDNLLTQNYAYNRALILDLRLGGITKYNFHMSSTTFVTDLVVIRNLFTSPDKLIMFGHLSGALQTSTWKFNAVAYDDLGIVYKAYLLTNYELGGSPTRRKQAPYVWVYSKRTETGYRNSSVGGLGAATGSEYVPINDSSTYLQTRWDWSDNSISGKWGNPQQVYRHSRTYIPENGSLDFSDGAPLIVTKSLTRGSGKAMQLYFSNSDAQRDSHIAGWNVFYSLNPQG